MSRQLFASFLILIVGMQLVLGQSGDNTTDTSSDNSTATDAPGSASNATTTTITVADTTATTVTATTTSGSIPVLASLTLLMFSSLYAVYISK